MRTEEEVAKHYNNYVKMLSKAEAYASYLYFLGAAYALGFTLGKTIPEVRKDIEAASKKANR